MGRVKELWQQQREEEFRRRVKAYTNDGISIDTAEMRVADEMEEEDEANGQFGMCA